MVGLTLSDMAPVIRASTDGATDAEMRAGRSRCLDPIDRLDWRREPIREAMAELRRLLALISAKCNPTESDGR
jgi:hypothetical protein